MGLIIFIKKRTNDEYYFVINNVYKKRFFKFQSLSDERVTWVAIFIQRERRSHIQFLKGFIYVI